MTTEELQTQKLQLEIDKLNNDIQKSNASFLRTSDFWKSIIPTMITTCGLLATLYFTVGKSFMDDEKRKLELQKEELKLDISRFDNVKFAIQKDIASSTVDKNLLLSKIKNLQNQKRLIGGNVNLLRSNVSKLNETINDLNLETYAIKSEYEGVKLDYSKDTAYYRSVIDRKFMSDDTFKKQLAILKQKNEVFADSILDLIVANDYLKKKRKLNEINLIDLNEAVLKAKIERSKKLFNKYMKEADAASKSAEKSHRSTEKSMIEVDRIQNQIGEDRIYLPSLLELSEQRKASRKQK